MLLTVTCEAAQASDLGYLLHKNPANVYQARLAFGSVTAFYPECSEDRCTIALLLEIDPIGLVRGNRRRTVGLDHYVNDRPYVASSLLSNAIAETFGTALNGRSRERPDRVAEKLPLRARIAAIRCSGGSDLIARLFEPLGYTVTTEQAELDARFPEWGDSDVFSVTLEGEQTVQALLTHLYVLIPVLDNSKHYYVGADEMEKLLKHGEGWLPAHPAKELITRRYLAYKQAMIREALGQMEIPREDTTETQEERDEQEEAQERSAEEPLRLNEARMLAAVEAVRSLRPTAARVLDLGCGEGRLLKLLMAEREIKEIVGVDVASHTLEHALRRLHMDTLPERVKERVRLIQGSVVYRDDRFRGFDVALMIEVIEHLDAGRLAAMEQVVFRHAHPRRIVITTPNSEYNVKWPSLPADRFRHRDHRFEWTRAQFQSWARRTADAHDYMVSFLPVGPEDPHVGSPTQMALFDGRN